VALEIPALPPEEAIAYLRAKGLRLTESFDWRDLWQESHAAAFTVAKSAGFDILKDIHDAVTKAVAEGTGFDEFKRDLIPTLQAKGWWGRADLVDPARPDLGPQNVQLGSVWRLKVIYDTNMRMAYAAGRWNQIQRNAEAMPYLRYSAVLDSRTRPLHRAWSGTVLPISDDWWNTHFPPCGWFCRCSVQSFSEDDLARHGLSISDGPPADPSPPREYENPRTGEVAIVPAGIDPGFGYNPGAAAIDAHAARVAASKWVDAPPGLTAADQAASIAFLRPLLVRDFGKWVNGIADQVGAGSIKPIGDMRVVGALTQDTLDFLAARSIEPESGAVTITDKVVAHMLRDAKVDRGGALPAADLQILPDIIADPDQILWDAKDPALLYVYDAGDKVGKIVVIVDFKGKADGVKVVTNAVRTGGLVNQVDLGELLPGGGARYIEVGDSP
jgi:SPP1 gp7 family putative phage head morphogenesis protein